MAQQGEGGEAEETSFREELQEAVRAARDDIDAAAREAEEQISSSVAVAEQKANWGWLGLVGLLGLLGLAKGSGKK